MPDTPGDAAVVPRATDYCEGCPLAQRMRREIIGSPYIYIKARYRSVSCIRAVT